MLEFLLIVFGLYVWASVSLYLYLVVKNYESLEIWTFAIGESHVGIFEYPKWLMGWMRYLAVKLNVHHK